MVMTMTIVSIGYATLYTYIVFSDYIALLSYKPVVTVNKQIHVYVCSRVYSKQHRIYSGKRVSEMEENVRCEQR